MFAYTVTEMAIVAGLASILAIALAITCVYVGMLQQRLSDGKLSKALANEQTDDADGVLAQVEIMLDEVDPEYRESMREGACSHVLLEAFKNSLWQIEMMEADWDLYTDSL